MMGEGELHRKIFRSIDTKDQNKNDITLIYREIEKRING